MRQEIVPDPPGIAVIKIAVIGCGWAGRRHAGAFAAHDARVQWGVDVDPNRSQVLSREIGRVRTTVDYREALADPEVDAVTICLPHHLHAPIAVDAARAGKHILCEKPLATSLQEADAMILAAEQAGVILMVAENVRYNPLFRRIRQILESGAIGEPALVQMTRECYLVRSFLDERTWFLDAHKAAGGIMMSGGIHDVETLRMLIGEIVSVQALRARQRFLEMEGDDTSVALFRFAGGAAGTMVQSFVMKSLHTASGGEVHTLRIDGDRGSISVHDGQTIVLFSEQEPYSASGETIEHRLLVPPADTFSLEIRHFLECIHTGQEPLTSGRSQRRPLEIVLAAYRSMETLASVAV